MEENTYQKVIVQNDMKMKQILKFQELQDLRPRTKIKFDFSDNQNITKLNKTRF